MGLLFRMAKGSAAKHQVHIDNSCLESPSDSSLPTQTRFCRFSKTCDFARKQGGNDRITREAMPALCIMWNGGNMDLCAFRCEHTISFILQPIHLHQFYPINTYYLPSSVFLLLSLYSLVTAVIVWFGLVVASVFET